MREVPVRLGWCESLNYHHETYPTEWTPLLSLRWINGYLSSLGSPTRQRLPRQRLSPDLQSGRWPETGFGDIGDKTRTLSSSG
ncbi:MAG TPA: hypothetical protein VG649_21575 [Candidatus Angelobacter sp.]|jgi:hypothetical protein|nr:hypothetical protein [Candidatus Angelobacter sp.]